MAYPILLSILGFMGFYLVLWVLLYYTHDSKEPPIVEDWIPFLGPLISVLRYRYKLYLHLFHRYKLPVYTFRLPFARLYIVNETSLITSLERHPKVTAFGPIEAAATVNLLGMGPIANASIKRNSADDDGHFVTFHKAIRPTLSPGPNLDLITHRAISSLNKSLGSLKRPYLERTKLFEWVQHELVIAITDAEFGAHNPFRDPAFEQAWLQFDPSVPALAGNMFPKVFARGGLEARELLTRGFLRYFSQGYHEDGSASLHARLKHSLEAGFSQEDIARGEVGACLAILNNTVPAAFWTLYHILSDKAVLEDCRRELECVTSVEDGCDVIDMFDIKSSCPVLSSTFQEVLRYRGIGTLIIRRVMEDHLLDNRYLLKSGGIVLIPHAVQHFKEDVWGSSARSFDHRRFVNSAFGSQKRFNPTAFRPFGAGSTLCPGRHFATTGVLAFVALALTGLKIEPLGGSWSEMNTDRSFGMGVARIFLLPNRDIETTISSSKRGPCLVKVKE